MNASPRVTRIGLLLVFGFVIAFCWFSPLDVSASSASKTKPPQNDMFAQASPLRQPTVYFTDSNVSATTEANEPYSSCAYSGPLNTVWYKFQPATDMPVTLTISGISVDGAWAIYSGTAITSLSPVTCGNYMGSSSFLAKSGQTYYIQYGSLYNGTGAFSLSLEPAPPPTAGISYYPWNSYASTTVEFYANTYDPAGQQFNSYAWDFGDGTTSNEANPRHMYIAAGQYTVSLTAMTADGRTATATTVLIVEPLPPVEAWFGYSPYDPSTFDTIGFWSNTYDPAGHSFVRFAWDFGDGVTSSDWYTTHTYAKEGTYTVSLTAYTDDGRSDSSSQVITIENHDVVITKVSVPSSARTLQTKPVSVGVTSKYRDEQVLVTLYKSVYGTYDSFEFVGLSRQMVRVEALNKGTVFDFNYTFTAADAKIGSVTFKAVVEIEGKRDLQSADNTFISLPVKVSGGKVTGLNAADAEGDDVLLFLPVVADN